MGNWKAPRDWQKLREACFAAHGHVCWRCGGYAGTVDHVVPVAMGGSHDPSNLKPACSKCNSRSGAAMGNRLRSGKVARRPDVPWPSFTPSRDW